jgi:acylphosphatase
MCALYCWKGVTVAMKAAQSSFPPVDTPTNALPALEQSQRRRLRVQGIVQGVGFRPFIYGLARRWNLGGFVLNDSDGVTIEIEGNVEALDRFQQALRADTPPLARIDSTTVELLPLRGARQFSIRENQTITAQLFCWRARRWISRAVSRAIPHPYIPWSPACLMRLVREFTA